MARILIKCHLASVCLGLDLAVNVDLLVRVQGRAFQPKQLAIINIFNTTRVVYRLTRDLCLCFYTYHFMASRLLKTT